MCGFCLELSLQKTSGKRKEVGIWTMVIDVYYHEDIRSLLPSGTGNTQ